MESNLNPNLSWSLGLSLSPLTPHRVKTAGLLTWTSQHLKLGRMNLGVSQESLFFTSITSSVYE